MTNYLTGVIIRWYSNPIFCDNGTSELDNVVLMAETAKELVNLPKNYAIEYGYDFIEYMKIYSEICNFICT